MDKNYGYKHTKGFILFIFIVIMMWIISSYAQVPDSYTNNLVNGTVNPTTSTSTWQNAGLINQGLPCWTPADQQKGAYCGPLPYTNSNTINFSYGLTDVYQKINVGKALPYSGVGLVNTGFKFEWESKNGNYWDDARLDVLSAYVKLYSSGDKKVIENFQWDLNYIHNWTTFSYDKNWSNTKLGYRENQVGNVQFGFIGMDNNYFAGPYGPEIKNISFQLKYKPDPCKNNPLFSPECPNFTQELAKNNTTTTTNNTYSNNEEPLPHKSTGTQSFSDPKESPYEEGVNNEFGSDNSERLFDTLIKISDNQAKEEKLTMDSSKTAIQETDNIAKQTLRQAEKTASKFVMLSMENKVEGLTTTDVNTKDKSSQSLTMFQVPSSISNFGFQIPGANLNNQILQTPSNVDVTPTVSNYNIQVNRVNQSNNYSLVNESKQLEQPNTSIIMNTTQTYQTNMLGNLSQGITLGLINPLVGQTIDTPSVQTSFLTNKADPINSIIENKPKLEEKREELSKSSVKQNVQDNDLAIGVPLTQLAVAPIGYSQYTNLVLKDAAFYAPKEIYRNQKTVDNVRALRQMASDRLHQEMVDQQYRR